MDESDEAFEAAIYDTVTKKRQTIESLQGTTFGNAAFIGDGAVFIRTQTDYEHRWETMVQLPSMQCIMVEDDRLSEISTYTAFLSGSSECAYVGETSDTLLSINAQGQVQAISTELVDEYGYTKLDRTLQNISTVSLSPSGQSVFASIKDTETSEIQAQVLHFEHDLTTTVLAISPEDMESLSIVSVCWMSEDTVALLLSNRTVRAFSAVTGEEMYRFIIDDVFPAVIGVVAVDADHMAMLCCDQMLYEMDQNGYTGRAVKLEQEENAFDKEIRGATGANSSYLSSYKTSRDNELYIVWGSSDKTAWIVDLQDWKIRYRIEHYIQALPDGDRVLIDDYSAGVIGWFPVYSTKQLVDKATAYLSSFS
ncbi:MAG: hypothetical protein IJU16_04795 [Clostridia bacterium]|nr:hypothetical protein [Clostridia bacterium]